MERKGEKVTITVTYSAYAAQTAYKFPLPCSNVYYLQPIRPAPDLLTMATVTATCSSRPK